MHEEDYLRVLEVFGPPVEKKVLVEKIPLPSVILRRGKHCKKLWLNKYGEPDSKYGNPAEIKQTGTAVWYKNGRRHRDGDMPAEIVYGSGTMIWIKNGEVWREGLKPAMITMSNAYWYESDVQILQLSIQDVVAKISDCKKFDKLMSLITKRKADMKETYNDGDENIIFEF